MEHTTINLTLRIPADLHAALAEMAKTEDRSLNSQVVHLLRRSVSAPK
jgi:predicted HicB family RNase H-like nuclease